MAEESSSPITSAVQAIDSFFAVVNESKKIVLPVHLHQTSASRRKAWLASGDVVLVLGDHERLVAVLHADGYGFVDRFWLVPL